MNTRSFNAVLTILTIVDILLSIVMLYSFAVPDKFSQEASACIVELWIVLNAVFSVFMYNSGRRGAKNVHHLVDDGLDHKETEV